MPEPKYPHNPDICGIDFHESCPKCQRGWLNDPERIKEIPPHLYKLWTGKDRPGDWPPPPEQKWKGR